MPDFCLQFAQSELSLLIDRHKDEYEHNAMRAGQRISSGEYTRENLTVIFCWKTNRRGITRLEKNSDAEIADALRLAIDASTERAAIAVLTGLYGVEVPVASAILTAINPTKYTIIDFRALAALGHTKQNISVSYYISYLNACRKLAAKHNVTLRELDHALWQWSKEQPIEKAKSKY